MMVERLGHTGEASLSPLGSWQSLAMSATADYVLAGGEDELTLGVQLGGNSSLWRRNSTNIWSQVLQPNGVAASGSFNTVSMSCDGQVQAAFDRDAKHFWISRDYGATFASLNIGFEWAQVAVSCDGTKIAAAPSGGQIQTSSDGYEWAAVGEVQDWQSVSMSSDASVMAAIVSNGSIWTSNDGGANWTEDTSVGSAKMWNRILVQSDGSAVFASVKNSGLWKGEEISHKTSFTRLTTLTFTSTTATSSTTSRTATTTIASNSGPRSRTWLITWLCLQTLYVCPS